MKSKINYKKTNSNSFDGAKADRLTDDEYDPLRQHSTNTHVSFCFFFCAAEHLKIIINIKNKIKMLTLRNKSENVFTDISSESYRVYTIPSYLPIEMHKPGFTYQVFHEYRINEPVSLSVSASGGHRILDNSGKCHYIPKGFVAISWEVKEGEPHFVK